MRLPSAAFRLAPAAQRSGALERFVSIPGAKPYNEDSASSRQVRLASRSIQTHRPPRSTWGMRTHRSGTGLRLPLMLRHRSPKGDVHLVRSDSLAERYISLMANAR